MERTSNSLDTSRVRLPSELAPLAELLARHNHDVWARQREREGWQVGASRDDRARTHPSLVPYEQLPESEKEYDRHAVQETLKAIVSLGFAILPPLDGREAFAGARADGPSIAPATVPQLIDAWRQARASPLPIETYRLVADGLLKVGEPLLAYDVCRAGLERAATDVRLRQLSALSLARSGASDKASAVLAELLADGDRDGETLGLLGRIYKDLASRSYGATRARALRRAHKAYAEGFDLSRHAADRNGAIYTGINAATTGALLGRVGNARALARTVEMMCVESAAEDYWTAATRAEAALIHGDVDTAAVRYREAIARTTPPVADVSTTRKQARLLLKAIGHAPHELDDSFQVPPVLVLRPGTESETLCSVLASIRGGQAMVYALLERADDAVVIEAAMDAGCEVRIVLPWTISPAHNRNGRRLAKSRISELLTRASSVVVAHDLTDQPSHVALRFAELIQTGLARLRASALDTDLVIVPSRGSRERPSLHSAHRGGTARLRPGMVREEVVAILFADAVNFSRLTDTEVPMFMEHFVGMIAGLTRSTHARLLAGNTWGDGFYFVFRAVRDAGRFALALSDRIGRTDWHRKGLPRDLNLRIALHAGPTFACIDPITRRRNYVGAHVSRAARIEPITPPGAVYASEAFAAIAAATNVSEFACEYAGQRPLAKGYGTLGTYRVHAGARPGRTWK